MARLLADWRQSKQRMELVTKNLPRIIGKEGVDIIRKNFDLEGYDNGRTFKKWAPRDSATNKRYDKRTGVKGSVFQSSNKILYQTGDLYNALDYNVEGQHITIGVNLALIPYAKIHNEGGPGTAWGHPFVMKQRQYMPLPGDPQNIKIMKAVQAKVAYETAQAMKNFAQ